MYQLSNQELLNINGGSALCGPALMNIYLVVSRGIASLVKRIF
jgi:hypothetical protein